MKQQLLAIYVLCIFILAQQPPEFSGRLESTLMPDNSGFGMVMLKPTTQSELSKLQITIGGEDKAFSGKMYWRSDKGYELNVIIVEPEKGPDHLYVDTNRDGVISKQESRTFSKAEEDSRGTFNGEVLLKIPLTIGPFKEYPVLLRRFRQDSMAKQGNRGLLYTVTAFAVGHVRIQGRDTRVEYSGFNPKTGLIDSRRGSLGIDTNGDGKVAKDTFSTEFSSASGEDIVFRIGDQYVSTRSIDISSGVVTLQGHDPSDYKRAEVKIGAPFPDFSFQDFEGKSRTLSEFRGKYLLLEFWATWCGPCVAEVPHLRNAYAKYKERGFEIIGMDNDDDQAQAKAFVTNYKLTWPQAATPSIKDFLENRLRVKAYPSTVLLDREGRVVSLGLIDQLPLRDVKLLETLEKLLPAKK